MSSVRLIPFIFLGMVSALPVSPSVAQDWPSRTVTIIVPYSAGGGVDPVARLVAQRLGERVKQQVLVDNRPGASGMIGTTAVARAKPDAYTLLMSASDVIAINPHLFANMTYDPDRDLQPVTQVVRLPFLFVSSSALPAKSLKELVALARARPGELSYASGGTGSLQHLAAAMFEAASKTRMVHVPYKGVVPALNDVLGGQVPMLFAGFPTAYPHVSGGRLRALGVTSTRRMDQAKEIPTIAEQGFPGFEVVQWFGVFLPAKAPKEVLERVHRELVAVLATPDVRERLTGQGAEPVGSTVEQFTQFTQAESRKFARIIKDAGIRLE
jgi:tripartite-type tricarboxylate transporter receptor subunit TctC